MRSSRPPVWAIVLVVIVLMMCGCCGVLGYMSVRFLNGVTRMVKDMPLGYWLTDCTPKGATLLGDALRAKGITVTNMTVDKKTSIGVSKADWSAAKTILHRLLKDHPKEFSNEAAAPTRKITIGSWQAAGDSSFAPPGLHTTG